VKNHLYFMIFTCVLVFDYLVWTRKYDRHTINPFAFNCAYADLLALMDTALSSPSCVLPDAVCKVMSADMSLISVALRSTLQAIGTPLFQSLLIRFAPLLSFVSSGPGPGCT
jgi:hypothetical protein